MLYVHTTPRKATAPSMRSSPRASVPTALKLMTVAIFLPDELAFRLGGLLLSPLRLILMVLTPVVLSRFARLMRNGQYRFVFSDLFVPLTGVWIIWSLMHSETVQDAINRGGLVVLEFCVTYIATRTLLSDGRQAIAFIGFLCSVIAIVGLLGAMDTVSHRYFTHELMRSLLGGAPIEDAGSRLGLLRATSTLEHPILLGFVCSVGLLLAASVPIRARLFAVSCCFLGMLLALSAGPIQTAVIGFGLLAYNRVLSGIQFRWGVLIALGIAGITILFVTVDNPFGFVFNHLTFDAQSAYYRIYIWTVASAAVSDSPIWGWGFVLPAIYDVPRTVDSVWLLWSLIYGIPGAVLLALSITSSASLPTTGRNVHLTVAESKLGTTLGIQVFLILFLGFTVDYFGNGSTLIPLLIGVRARLGELGKTASADFVRSNS